MPGPIKFLLYLILIPVILLVAAAVLVPIFRHARIVIDQTSVSVDVQQGRRDTLSCGKTGGHGVAAPEGSRIITMPTPQIHHAFAAMVNADGGTAGIVVQLMTQGRFNTLEIRMDTTIQM